MTTSYSLLTKTFKGDYAPFKRLCASIDMLMPDVRHYVLLDDSDMLLFAPFSSPNRVLINCRGVLPQFSELNIFGKRMWWGGSMRLVRGWIYQQLAKLQFVSGCSEDAIILVDSDAVFVRPLNEEHIFSGSKTVLFHNPGAPSGPPHESAKWHNASLSALGLARSGYTGFDYISQAVVWSPLIVSALLQRIEDVHRRDWMLVMLTHFRFSEYVLYGIFCEQTGGAHRHLFQTTEKELCHCSWHYDLGTPSGVDAFINEIDEYKVAVLIQSNLGLSEKERAEIIGRLQRVMQKSA